MSDDYKNNVQYMQSRIEWAQTDETSWEKYIVDWMYCKMHKRLVPNVTQPKQNSKNTECLKCW